MNGTKATRRFLLDRVPHNRQRHLSPSELATILHGLRTIQCEGRIEGCAAGNCEHFDEFDALTNEEIDNLCESINSGEVLLP